MSSIIAALDRTSSKNTPDMYLESKHYGENGTPQHGWGVEATKWTSKSEAQSLLTQLYFQLVRTHDHSDLIGKNIRKNLHNFSGLLCTFVILKLERVNIL